MFVSVYEEHIEIIIIELTINLFLLFPLIYKYANNKAIKGITSIGLNKNPSTNTKPNNIAKINCFSIFY